MPTEPAPDRAPFRSIRLRLQGHQGTTPWGVGFWLDSVGDPASGDLDDLAHQCYVAWFDNILGLQADEVHLEQSTVAWYGINTILEGTHVEDSGAGGGSSPLPRNCAALISWTIDEHYRGGKPRTYVPGLTQARLQDSAHISSSFQTSLHTGAVDLITDINAIDAGGITSVTLGCIRFFSGYQAKTPPTFHGYSGASVKTLIASQRRRLQ